MPPYDRNTIRQLRESLTMSQREFASHLAVPQTTVNRWETGRTTPNAEYLGMMYDLAQRHSVAFTPFAHSTRETERVDIAVEAAREWLRKSTGPRGKDLENWRETFHSLLTVATGADPALKPLLERAEASQPGETATTELLREVQRHLEGGAR